MPLYPIIFLMFFPLSFNNFLLFKVLPQKFIDGLFFFTQPYTYTPGCMAHTPVNVFSGDMQQNAEDHICAKLHVEHTDSCVLKCYNVWFFCLQ